MPLYDAGEVRKLVGSGGTPSLNMGAGAGGASASASIEGDNVSGVITITTGTSVSVNSPFLTLTLADNAAFPSKMLVHLTSVGSNPLDVAGSLMLADKTVNSNTFNTRGASLSALTTYELSYLITGYKK